MAAYAALISLMNNMEQIMNHPRLSTSFDKNQIESLQEKAGFLLDFTDSYNPQGGMSIEEIADLESQIASTAHAAEDVIESHIVDQILAGSTEKSLRCLLDLQKVIEDMDSIKEKVIKIMEGRVFKDQQPTYSIPTSSSTVPLTTGKSTMVGFDDELIQLMDMLTGQQSSRQIISIVGMGGTGKTTLAENVYENLVIMQHFDIRAWATISQEYNMKEIVLKFLSCLQKSTSGTIDELGEQLRKILLGRRYLIILDDMWSIEVWDKIKFFFPDNGNGSRVVITTRLSDVAIHCGCICFRMNFLDEDKSWDLFCEKVFGQEKCPPELVEIGKKIVEQCKGLPLSIVVIGGLLRKSYTKIKYWHNLANNINPILNSRENGQCLDILYLSYSQLPAHLKPCFLYMGTFQEDYEILVSEIIRLWVAEGFVKPNGVQILEETAEGSLKDLIDRNLILVCRHRPNGKIRSCRIHDLLRELCIREAEKEKFFCVMRADSIPQGIDTVRNLVFHGMFSSDYDYSVFEALQSASLARSLIGVGVDAPVKCRLLRVLSKAGHSSTESKFQNVNLRYFACGRHLSSVLSSSISLIWNLQTLIIKRSNKPIVMPLEIWKMPQLRHLKCYGIYLADPPRSDKEDDSFVLGNLQTLALVVNFSWNEEACKRIPNIKKLRINYHRTWKGYEDRLYDDLNNLGRLHKLESLNIWCYETSPILIYQLKHAFPSSLNKLCLRGCRLHWEDLTIIGSLPHLEVLKLGNYAVLGTGEWSPVEGEFLRLKFLSIEKCYLTSWDADSSHFPVLEKLVLGYLWDLDEIPLGIGEIPTLQLIRLNRGSESAIISAVKIKEEQESLGNYGLQIQVWIFSEDHERLRERVEREGLSINNIQLLKGWGDPY